MDNRQDDGDSHQGSPAKGIMLAFLLSVLFWALIAWIFLGAPKKAHAAEYIDRSNIVLISTDMHVLDAFSML